MTTPDRLTLRSLSSMQVDPLATVKALTVLKTHNADNPISNEQVFYLVGTAHISRSSCEDVQTVIRAVKPTVVFLELCPDRRNVLQADALKVHTLSEAITAWREGNTPLFNAIYSWYLGQMAANLECFPGEEFRVALSEADAVKAKVVLGDRPVNVTVARLWAAMSLWDRVRLMGQLLLQGLRLPTKEEMEKLLKEVVETDALTAMIEEVGASFPAIKHTLITERDMYMATMLHKLSSKATTIVAVVGAGHLPGIREAWEQEVDVKELLQMPEPRRSNKWRVMTLLGLAAGGVVVTAAVVRWRRR